MEEENHIHSNSTPSSHTLLHIAWVAAPLSLFFSSLHSHTLSLCSKKHASFIGKHGGPLQHICQHGGANKALNHATKCGTNGASTCLVVGYCHKWQYPNSVVVMVNLDSVGFDPGLEWQWQWSLCGK